MNEFFARQEEIRRIWSGLLGAGPTEKPAPDCRITGETEQDGFRRLDLSLAADPQYPDDRISAFLLLPDRAAGPLPTVLALHPTTFGCGKKIVIGEAENSPYPLPDAFRSRPAMLRNRAYALDLVAAGFAVYCPDTYADGDRVEPGFRPYEPATFYRRYPGWSMVGKTVWDLAIGLDFLQTRPELDPARFGVIGHSLGGHSAIFAAAADARIRAICSNGGCTVFRKYLEHWSRLPLPPPVAAAYPPIYTYIPGFRPYLGNSQVPNPLEFGDLMGLVAPRPLLYAGATDNDGQPGRVELIRETWDVALSHYEAAGSPGALEYYIYPGSHDFPPKARAYAIDFLARMLSATP